jgi:hypothetical protein
MHRARAARIIQVCFYLVVSLIGVHGFTQESDGAAGVFLRMGVGARPLGLGETYVGLAEGPSAAYWNPSGLGRIQNFQFEFMNTNLPFDRTLYFFGGALPIKNVMTMGISWIGFRVNDIESRSGNTRDPDFTFSSSQNMIALSLGKSLAPFVAIGGNVKFIKYNLGEQSAAGLGFDAGILLHPIEQLGIGLMAQDIGADYRWSSGLTEGVPPTYRAGVALKVYEGVVLAADLNKSGDLAPRLHVGGEIRPVFFLPLRIGYHNGQVSGGAGFLAPFSAHSLEFNYSYTNDRIFNDAVHQISLVFSFGSYSSNKGAKTSAVRPPAQPKFEAPSPKSNATNTVRRTPKAVVVTAALLNVRSGPSTKHRRIAQIRNGEKFEVVAEEGQWLKIKLRSGIGWVRRDYVRMID